MNQTSWIAGGIFIGFIVYITIKGELPAYKDAILGTSTAAQANSGSQFSGLSGIFSTFGL